MVHTQHKSSKHQNKLIAKLDEYFPGNAYTALSIILALIFALSLFMLGFFKTLLLTIFIFVAVCIGQYFDGNPRIIHAVQKFFAEKG